MIVKYNSKTFGKWYHKIAELVVVGPYNNT